MIKVHHLNNSRSQRILWMLEELAVPYEIISYKRNPETHLAPDSLKAVHPLGKSPVMEDGNVIIAESGAIIDYLIRTYGNGNFAPDTSSAEYNSYVEWLHYGEGSAMLPLMLGLYVGRLGEAGAPLQPRIQSEFINHFSYMAKSLGGRSFFVGDSLTGADVQLVFVLEAANVRGALSNFPNLDAYLKNMQARPAYKRAIERGGVYQLGSA
ncbi:glutathione S-transferase family protein [Kordiimonas pumila]|uniref:Glutathione S-transferase family protein n=1 Tax=Kordiimonas pumila TaxID=2161677 RepID=A0ABV7D7J8_9PROT|nr:glutathione S-transferase [Kordiimonas pumila]